MGFFFKIIEVGIDAEEAVNKMGDYVQHLSFISLWCIAQVIQGADAFFFKFCNQIMYDFLVFEDSLMQPVSGMPDLMQPGIYSPAP